MIIKDSVFNVFESNAKSVFSMFCLAATYYVFLFRYQFAYNYIVEINFHYFLFTSVITSFSIYLALHFFKTKCFSYNKVDAFFALLLVISFAGILFKHHSLNLNNEYFVCCVVILMIYFMVRTSPVFISIYFIPILVSIFFIVELYVGLYQLINFGADVKLSLAIRGSLLNSGVYSYYLVINIPLLFYVLNLLPLTKIIKKISFVITILLVSVILLITQSRTAIAILGVLSFFLAAFNQHYRLTKSIVYVKANKVFFCLLLAILIIVLIYFLTRIKVGSFYGRLFVWQVTISHFADYFISGIGIGNFSFYYPKWQIEYFSTHNSPSAFYFLNADETTVAFNEFLQIIVEMGLLGFMAFSVIIILILKIKSQHNKQFFLSLKFTIYLIFVGCLFSYPLHCNGILFLFIFCIASLLHNPAIKIYVYSKHRVFNLFFICNEILLGFACYSCAKQCVGINKWNNLREDLFLPPIQVKTEYLKLYPSLNTNGKFLLDMGEHLYNMGETNSAISILESSKHFYTSYRTLLSTANAYYQSGNTKATIINLEELSNLVPYKFYPKYQLVKLYYKCGDTTKAMAMSKIIISMPVKIMSTDINKIKQEVIQMMK